MFWLFIAAALGVENGLERRRYAEMGVVPPWSVRHPLCALFLTALALVGGLLAVLLFVVYVPGGGWFILVSGVVAVIRLAVAAYRRGDRGY